MQYILEQLQYIYDNLRDNNEIVIYDKYGNTAKRMTIAFISKKKVSCCAIHQFLNLVH